MKKRVIFPIIVGLALIGCNEVDTTVKDKTNTVNNETQTDNLNTLESATLPKGYSYKAINNRGLSVHGTIGDYKIEILANHEEEIDAQSRHYSIVVQVGEEVSEEIPIQLSYVDKTVVIAIYKENKLVGMSDILTVDDVEPLMLVDVDVEE